MATTMHFGPEWMRAKQQPPVRTQAAPSPPPALSNTFPTVTAAPPGASTYSALLSPPPPPVQVNNDVVHPFKYSKEDMLRILREGGGGGSLPIEVEIWEGVVREAGGDPVCTRELSELEKKLFSTPLNSELRRRQSADYVAQVERSKPLHSNSIHGGGLRDGSGLGGRRRRGDSNGTVSDQPPVTILRKTSWSAVPGTLNSPGLPSPRTRLGSQSGAFDGVLSSGDTWTGGKRRPSAGLPFNTRAELDNDPAVLEIKEVDEPFEEKLDNHEAAEPSPVNSSPTAPLDAALTGASDANSIASAVAGLTLRSTIPDTERPYGEGKSNSIHPEAHNLSGVQWSYLDPAGNTQGPFPGDTMQSWFDQQYFPDDLLMKRINIDANWMTVADLRRRATGERIFLSPLSEFIPPPGLPRRTPDSAFIPTMPRTGHLLRDQVSSASGSPSSSFGGSGFSRPSLSPDPIAIGGRTMSQPLTADALINGRLGSDGFASSSSPAQSFPAPRRPFTETTPESSFGTRNELSAASPTRTTSFDAHGANNGMLSNAPWQTALLGGEQPWDGSSRLPVDLRQQYSVGRTEAYGLPSEGFGHALGQDPIGPIGIPFEQQGISNFSGAQSGRPSLLHENSGLSSGPLDLPSRPYLAQPRPEAALSMSTAVVADYNRSIISPVTQSGSASHIQSGTTTRHSPWLPTPEKVLPRPSPFDADQPTSSNTFVAKPPAPPKPPAWQGSLQEVQSPDVLSWLSESQGAMAGDSWGQTADEPQSIQIMDTLSTSAEARRQSVKAGNPLATVESAPALQGVPSETAQSPAAVSERVPNAVSTLRNTPVAPASKRKATTEPGPQHPASLVAAAASPTHTAHPKLAWSTEEDAKAKQSAMSLREIQEAEKRAQIARKAVSEKERAAKAAAAVQMQSDTPTFTATWGLPTSQVASRGTLTPVSKDVAPASAGSSTSASSNHPVWTNAVKPAAKKTMKEIQEEEEQRKKALAKEKETLATAVKRAAQGETSAKTAATAALSGGSWTTVGTSGKPSSAGIATRASPVATAPVQPQPAPTRTLSNPPPSPVRPPTAAQTVKPSPTLPRADEEPAPPSLEFLKWMKDSLRGLNSSVQFEEIAQMLLSFPLDPDASTVELIAETVYGASTTLDGRRFAAEFVAKRKVDSAARPRGTPGAKVTSLADVVKTQPKQPQSEWAYKVVKKKGKGGRS